MMADPSLRVRTFSSEVIGRIVGPGLLSTSIIVEGEVRPPKFWCFVLFGLRGRIKILGQMKLLQSLVHEKSESEPENY